MKRILAYSLLVLMIVSSLGLSGPVSYAEAEAPAVYSIPYPENYPTAEDEEGASAFAGSLDHPQSDYTKNLLAAVPDVRRSLTARART